MSVEIDVRYEGKLRCTSVHKPSGTELTTDAPKDNGGRGEAFSPTDLVATALGTCVLTIMGLAAEKRGLELAGTTVRVVKEMATSPTRRIGRLSVLVIFPKGLKLSGADRAVLEKAVQSCPVRQSLHPNVQIQEEFIQP